MKKPPLGKHGYLWATLLFFLVSLGLHWGFGWKAYVNESETHNQPAEFAHFFNQSMRDTMENWQSEFLQLIWQVAGLAYLLYIGSPQSKEGDERKEEKLDAILKALDPKNAESTLKALEKKYPKS